MATSPLRAHRKAERITLEQLAERLGVNKSTVLRWEEGVVPEKWVIAVSKETGIAPAVLRPDLAKLMNLPKSVAAE
jgi:transcriptional regulator with XRE-family HTH domain